VLESKTFRVCFSTILLMCAFSCGQALSAQEIQQPIAPADYRVRVGDVLEVSVYQHPELSTRIVVMGDGNHTLTVDGVTTSGPSAIDELLHDLQVVGLPALDVAVLVRAKLESIISKPQVTVTVTQRTSWPQAPSERPSRQLQDTPSPQSLPKHVLHPSQRLRDVPAPEHRDCCVA
jgi:protein involved in polysaccharide export with SLBB domain